MGERFGMGVGGMIGYRFANTPFMVGADLGFMNFGKEKREEPLSSTIPDLRVEVENSYNLFHADALFRIIPSDWVVRPFLDGLVGINHFYTETVMRERGTTASDDEKLRDTNFRDTALSYGFGGGVQFRIYTHAGYTEEENGLESMPYEIGIIAKGRYMNGREAEYLREGSIHRENGEVTFDVHRSTTDLIFFDVGIVVSF